MIFGIFDDDTEALINTALANYNVPLVALMGLAFYLISYFLIFQIIKKKEIINVKWNIKK